MNPLPNRPLLNNSSLPLSLPNVPTFDPVAFNGRPRKVMPDVKDYPILNGMSNIMSGPPSASSTSQNSPLDRAGILGSAILQSQQPNTGGPLGPQVQLQPAPSPTEQQVEGKETESETQQGQGSTGAGQLTAIFRDEDGQWREKLREAAEQARASQLGGTAASGAASWERRSQPDEEEAVKPEEEPEVEEEEGTEIGDSEGGKVWKAKRTLRKSVSIS